MTSARPIAISRSRVQTRISLRREFAGDATSQAGADEFPETGIEEITAPGFSGRVEAPRCFGSERSIFLCFAIYSMGVAARATRVFAFYAKRAQAVRNPAFPMIPVASAALHNHGKNTTWSTADLEKSCPGRARLRLLSGMRVIQRRQGGNYRCFGSKNQAAERAFS